MPMRKGRAGAVEVTVRIEHPDELFEARAADVEQGRPPEPPVIDRIREELSVRGRATAVTVTVELPEGKATPEIEDGIKQAVRRYCEIGILKDDYEPGA